VSSNSARQIGRFRRDQSGNIAVIFALSLMPILSCIGCAIDYSRAVQLRSKLQAAIDTASVGSVAKTSAAFIAAGAMRSDGSIAVGATDATSIFNGNMSGVGGYTLNSMTATVTKTGGILTSTTQFSAQVPTTFLGVMGKSVITVTGTSNSTASMPLYIDFYLLLDNSPSMGVGATPTDVATMVANTSDACAFACHDTSTSSNYYNLAKTLGVKTRIDVLRSATQSLMDTAASTQTYTSQFRMAIYDFGASASNAGLRNLFSLSSSLSSAKTAAGAIDLMTVNGQNENNDQDTNFTNIFPAINNAICSSCPMASPTKTTAARASSRPRAGVVSLLSTPLSARPSRAAASRSQCCTRPISRCRPTPGTTAGSRRSTPGPMVPRRTAKLRGTCRAAHPPGFISKSARPKVSRRQ
jgi:Flp pilus assembly protein TadG